MSATTKWITLALLGLAIAAAVAFLASRLVSEQIGIASESVSAGYDLAPAVRSATAPNTKTGNKDPTTPSDTTQTTPPESTTDSPSTTGDDAVDPDQLADELEDREKEREDELKDLEKEREDREDEIRDEEEDRRDD
ncbi:MAG TPA: hypothetical protein VFB52_06570 [Solirubrobacterales bacterium]|nr:hypothetical protein [Solirubrobacterales bacterium]